MILPRALLLLAAVFSAVLVPAVTVCAGVCENPASPTIHSADTRALMTMVEHDASLKTLLEESIAAAAAVNPDPSSNPAQSLAGYYDFLDWAATAMPFDILPSAGNYPKLYESIDQSLDYFYFLIDQPLDELKDRGLYHNSVQYVEPFRSWMIAFTKNWGLFLSTPASWNDEFYKKALADERFGLANGWYEDPSNWHTFNQFFCRHLSSPAARPIAAPQDDAIVTSPADSTPQGVWAVDKDSRIVGAGPGGVVVKSTGFDSVADLLGPGMAYADSFANGVLTHTFLDVNDYHRYHFPVSGKVLEVRTIPADDAVGGVQIWSAEKGKYVLIDKKPGWQTIETRACVVVDTGATGLVAILPVGMSQVSSVNFEPEVVPGITVKKGDPLGWFLFGGSDIVMLFQPQSGFTLTAPKDPDDLEAYAHLLMGQAYGKMTPAK